MDEKEAFLKWIYSLRKIAMNVPMGYTNALLQYLSEEEVRLAETYNSFLSKELLP